MTSIKRNGSTTKWRKLRLRVLERDQYICYYCGIPKATHVDHITPFSQNGTDELSNLISACQNCNLSKGSKSIKQFQKDRGQKMSKLFKQTAFFEGAGHPPTPAMFLSPKDLKTPFEVPDKGE